MQQTYETKVFFHGLFLPIFWRLYSVLSRTNISIEKKIYSLLACILQPNNSQPRNVRFERNYLYGLESTLTTEPRMGKIFLSVSTIGDTVNSDLLSSTVAYISQQLNRLV